MKKAFYFLCKAIAFIRNIMMLNYYKYAAFAFARAEMERLIA